MSNGRRLVLASLASAMSEMPLDEAYITCKVNLNLVMGPRRLRLLHSAPDQRAAGAEPLTQDYRELHPPTINAGCRIMLCWIHMHEGCIHYEMRAYQYPSQHT